MSKSRYLSILALAAFVGLAACARDDAGREGENGVVSQDTATVPSTETVVRTVTEDTLEEGEAADTTAGDTAQGDTAAKNP